MPDLHTQHLTIREVEPGDPLMDSEVYRLLLQLRPELKQEEFGAHMGEGPHGD